MQDLRGVLSQIVLAGVQGSDPGHPATQVGGGGFGVGFGGAGPVALSELGELVDSVRWTASGSAASSSWSTRRCRSSGVLIAGLLAAVETLMLAWIWSEGSEKQ